MDSAYLHLIVAELQSELRGASLVQALASDSEPNDRQARNRKALLLEFRIGGMHRHLLLNANPSLSCLYLLAQPPAKPSQEARGDAPTPFVQSVRRTLLGARLQAIEQPPWERLVRFRFQSAAGGISLQSIELIAELTGRNSNLLLVEAESGEILDCLRSVVRAQSRVRRIVRGARYEPPPSYDRPTLGRIGAEEFTRAWNAAPTSEDEARLRSIVAGLSPSMQAEVVARARTLDAWSTDQASAVWQAACDVQRLLEGPPQPCLYLHEDGAGATLAPFALSAPPSTRTESVGGPSETAERYYARQAEQHGRGHLQERLFAAVRQKLRQQRRKLQRLDADLLECRKAQGCGAMADLILAHLHDIPLGAERVDLPDWNDPGQRVSIELDPTLSQSQNAERYYKKQRKATRAEPILEQQQETIRQLMVDLEEAQHRLQDAASLDELRQWEAWAIRQSLLSPARSDAPSNAPRPGPKAGVRHYRTHDGWEILVGAHSRGNDYLTTKIARGHDLWLHAYGVAGSHVVIRNPNKASDVPQQVIQQAAHLAAHFSKAHNNTRVDVIVTSRRHVKKRKGMPPGKVTVEKHDTITLNPQEPGSRQPPQFVASS